MQEGRFFDRAAAVAALILAILGVPIVPVNGWRNVWDLFWNGVLTANCSNADVGGLPGFGEGIVAGVEVFAFLGGVEISECSGGVEHMWLE